MPVFVYKTNIESTSDISTSNFSPASSSDAKNSVFLKNDILNGDDTSLGWKVFEAEKQPEYGSSYTTINIATVFTQDEYRIYRSYLEDLNRCSNDGFFSPDSGVNGYYSSVDEYSVFSFLTNGKFIPLKKVSDNVKKEMASFLYEAMLKVISFHKNSGMCEQVYVPLNCICEENIYLSQNGNEVTVKLLPMVAKSKMNDKDISVDLYDAAYLYFKLRYPKDEKFEDDESELFIQKCFLPFKQARPSFEDIVNYFGIKESNDDSVNFENTGNSIYNKDDAGTSRRVPKPINKTHEKNTGSENSDLVKDFGDKVKNVFSSTFKNISKAISQLETNEEDDNDDGTVENK